MAISPGGRPADDSSLDASPRANWVEKAGGLPKYVRMVAHALIRKGMPKDKAIPSAINRMRRWAAGEDNVRPQVQAAAAAALAEWEAKKGMALSSVAWVDSAVVLDLAALPEWQAELEATLIESVDIDLAREYVRDASGRFARDNDGNRIVVGSSKDREPRDERKFTGPRKVENYDTTNLGAIRKIMATWSTVPPVTRANLKAKLAKQARALDASPKLLALIAGLGDGDGKAEAGEGSAAALRKDKAGSWLKRAGFNLSADDAEAQLVFELAAEVSHELETLDLAELHDSANTLDLAPGDYRPPYDWKHGYIPLTHAAVLSKAGKGPHAGKGRAKPPKAVRKLTAGAVKKQAAKQAADKAKDDDQRGRGTPGAFKTGDPVQVTKPSGRKVLAEVKGTDGDHVKVQTRGSSRVDRVRPENVTKDDGGTGTKAPAAGTRFMDGGKEYEVRPGGSWNNGDGEAIVSAALVKDGKATSYAKNVKVAKIQPKGAPVTDIASKRGPVAGGLQGAAARAAQKADAEGVDKLDGLELNQLGASSSAKHRGMAEREKSRRNPGSREANMRRQSDQADQAQKQTPSTNPLERFKAAREAIHASDAGVSGQRATSIARQGDALEKAIYAQDEGKAKEALAELLGALDTETGNGPDAMRKWAADMQEAVPLLKDVKPRLPRNEVVKARQPGIDQVTEGQVEGYTDNGMVKVSYVDRNRTRQTGTFNPAHVEKKYKGDGPSSMAGAKPSTDKDGWPKSDAGDLSKMSADELRAERDRMKNYIAGRAGGTASDDDVARWTKRKNEAIVALNQKPELEGGPSASPRSRGAIANDDTAPASRTTSTNPDAPIRIEHSAEGTIVQGTSREDAAAIKEVGGFKWSRNLNAWYLPRTWGEATRNQRVKQLEAKLGDKAGVDRTTGGPRRTAAEKDAETRERAAARAERMDSRAEKRSAEAQRRFEASDLREEKSGIPFGQPILVGHHSERRHRRAIEKAHNSLGKGVEAQRDAESAAAAADRARRTAAGDESKTTIGNRIEKNQRDLRDIDRKLDGTSSQLRGKATGDYRERLIERKAELEDKIEFDKGKLDAKGGVPSKDTVSPGDFVKIRGQWYPVKKSNAKTVSHPHWAGRNSTSPWHEVQEHRKAGDVTRADVAKMVQETSTAFPGLKTELAKAAPEKDPVKAPEAPAGRSAGSSESGQTTAPTPGGITPESAEKMSAEQLDRAMERLMAAGTYDGPAFSILEAEMDRRDRARAEGKAPRR